MAPRSMTGMFGNRCALCRKRNREPTHSYPALGARYGFDGQEIHASCLLRRDTSESPKIGAALTPGAEAAGHSIYKRAQHVEREDRIGGGIERTHGIERSIQCREAKTAGASTRITTVRPHARVVAGGEPEQMSAEINCEH